MKFGRHVYPIQEVSKTHPLKYSGRWLSPPILGQFLPFLNVFSKGNFFEIFGQTATKFVYGWSMSAQNFHDSSTKSNLFLAWKRFARATEIHTDIKLSYSCFDFPSNSEFSPQSSIGRKGSLYCYLHL